MNLLFVFWLNIFVFLGLYLRILNEGYIEEKFVEKSNCYIQENFIFL